MVPQLLVSCALECRLYLRDFVRDQHEIENEGLSHLRLFSDVGLPPVLSYPPILLSVLSVKYLFLCSVDPTILRVFPAVQSLMCTGELVIPHFVECLVGYEHLHRLVILDIPEYEFNPVVLPAITDFGLIHRAHEAHAWLDCNFCIRALACVPKVAYLHLNIGCARHVVPLLRRSPTTRPTHFSVVVCHPRFIRGLMDFYRGTALVIISSLFCFIFVCYFVSSSFFLRLRFSVRFLHLRGPAPVSFCVNVAL